MYQPIPIRLKLQIKDTSYDELSYRQNRHPMLRSNLPPNRCRDGLEEDERDEEQRDSQVQVVRGGADGFCETY